MITQEVNRALQTQMQVLSPRNRKPKQSRAPNIDDPVPQRLFSPKSLEETHTTDDRSNDSDDGSYEVSNALFEANMTT